MSEYYDIYVIMVFILKIIFLILAIIHIYLIYIDESNKELDAKIIYWKDRVDYVFKITMALLLFYIFNPYYDNTYLINNETKLLFYLFGIILIATANWNAFIHESKWYYIIGS